MQDICVYIYIYIHIYINIYKGKAIPLQAWTGPEGSRSFRLPDFKTIDTHTHTHTHIYIYIYRERERERERERAT